MVVRLDGGLTMLLPKIPYFTDLIHLQDCLKIGAISKKEICPMGNNPPVIDNDQRHRFYQGLFQQTLPGFISTHSHDLNKRLVIHMDADLFSSTLYVLTSLAPFLK